MPTTAEALQAMTIPEREAVEVERRYEALCRELQPSGELGMLLIRHAATMSARMESCVLYHTAMATERVRRAKADFAPPPGVDAAEASRLGFEAVQRALFDPSKEATLARRFEASAARGFFRTLKELRLVERAVKAEYQAMMTGEKLGSFSPGSMKDADFDKLYADFERMTERTGAKPSAPADFATREGLVDVPITVGRRR